MSQEIIKLMLQGIEETFYMVAVATVIAGIIGIPLGVTLVTTSKGHILQNLFINRILGTIVNIIRSVPFIILMVAIIPLTRLVAGTSIGTAAACVPLTIVAIGASAMAGAIGGGGLGDIAIRYGYQRFRPDVMLATIIILIVVVNLIQYGGDLASHKKNKK